MIWLICALLGGRALGEYGVYRLIHIVIFCLCFANGYPFMMRSADVLQTVRTCLFHNNSVVQNVANYGVLWAQCESPIGRKSECYALYAALQCWTA